MPDRLPPDALRPEDAEDLLAVVAAPDVLTAEELEALRVALRADAPRAAQVRALAQAEAALHAVLEADLPDRHPLVLLALEESGRGALLSADEQQRLHAARPSLERVCTRMPALRLVAQRIADEAETFEACWREALRARRDRAPVARARPRLWQAAVALAVVAFATVSVLLLQRDRGLVTTTAAVPNVVQLADGTTVRLAAGARLTYPDPARHTVLARQVRLRGDAYFDVAPAAEHFQVDTPSGRISVLGTVFGVRADARRTEVTLVEGALALQGSGRTVRLAPGEQSAVLRGAPPSAPAPVEVSRALAWSGLYVFRSTPLAAALAQLAEGHQVALSADAALQAQQVSGTFEATQPLTEVLDAIALTLGTRVTRTADGYRIG